MKDRSVSRVPIASFTTPPHPPKDAAAAIAKFNAIADQWAATLGEIDDAKLEAKQAQADAKRAVVEAAKAGKPMKTSIVGVGEEHAARVAELEAKASALAVAVDEVGNEMAVAVAENRGAWLEKLSEVAADAEARYSRALAEAQATLALLAPARGAVEWLTNFNHTEACAGRQPQFSGGRLTIEHRFPGTMVDEWNPRDLLAVAAKLLDPPVVHTPRVLKPAAESSRVAG